MFSQIGPMEIILVLVIALLVLGPKRLPEAGRSIGKGMREFKDSIAGINEDEDQTQPDRPPRASARSPEPARAVAGRMRIARELLEQIVAHARAEAPNECCGVVATNGDGGAQRVFPATNKPPARCASRSTSTDLIRICDGDRRRGRPRARRDLPLAHAHRARAVADRHQLRLLARRAVADRRPRREEPDVRTWSIDGRSRRAGGAGRRVGRWRPAPLPDVRRGPRRRGALLPALRRAARASRSADARRPSARQERARKVKPQYAEGELVQVARRAHQAEAELIQDLLLEEGIPSMTRRSGGFDVPDFLAAGPRDVLVPQLRAPSSRASCCRRGAQADASRARCERQAPSVWSSERPANASRSAVRGPAGSR